ncbi:MAG: alpha-N-arabinofuranosidase [Janthinobacterium lividum]
MKKQLTIFSLLFLLNIAAYSQQTAQATISGKDAKTKISRHIYGQFSEHLGRSIYDGFWVPEGSAIPNKGRIRTDIVEALKKIHIPNLRWPGGCFADEYHWRDGIGPRANRPKMVNTNWGGVTEDNSFGTNEFLELCEMLHCEPYIAGNVGSGTVEEMAKWVEYLNFDGTSPMAALRTENGHPKPFKVSFWGVGNESWGCGGNMTVNFYADQYKRYATYARDYPGTQLKKVASGANSDDYNWTEVAMKNIGTRMWGLSLHYYTLPTNNWKDKGSATNFDEKQYLITMRNCLHMEELVNKHSAIMDKYDPAKKVALVVDEWGIWTNVEPGTNPGFLFQQNSMRDALIAGTTLNIFNNHAERVKMANLAQTVNVLQSLVLTQKEKMILTPTYHVFDLYQVHQDATLLPISIQSPDYVIDDVKVPAVNASASRDSSGVVHISFVNLSTKKTTINTTLQDVNWKTVQGQVVTSPKFTDYNSFDQPNKIKPAVFNGAKKQGSQLVAELPALSVVVLTLKN